VRYGKGVYTQPLYNPLGDSFAKDMYMVVMQPVSLAISSAIITAFGLVKAGFNILPALTDSENSELLFSMHIALIGVGIGLLVLVAPFARMYNIATRVFAQAADPTQKVETNTGDYPTPSEIVKIGKEVAEGNPQSYKKLDTMVDSLQSTLNIDHFVPPKEPPTASEVYKKRKPAPPDPTTPAPSEAPPEWRK